jgi:DNA-binding NarL/FixJ family response regulator
LSGSGAPTAPLLRLQAAQRIRSEHPDVGVLVLSQYLEPSYALRLLEEHPESVAYLLKERVFVASALVDAVRRVSDVETHVTSIFHKLRHGESPDSHRRVLAVLSYLRA